MTPQVVRDYQISIHAPREGCDGDAGRLMVVEIISIHAPREGCDMVSYSRQVRKGDFNPRTP